MKCEGECLGEKVGKFESYTHVNYVVVVLPVARAAPKLILSSGPLPASSCCELIKKSS